MIKRWSTGERPCRSAPSSGRPGRLTGLALAALLAGGLLCGLPPATAQGSAPDFAGLLRDGEALLERSDFRAAVSLGEGALAQAERRHGVDSLAAAQALMLLASAHGGMGHSLQALAMQQRALAIREALLEPSHPLRADNLREVGATLWALARYDQALTVLQLALAVSEAAPVPEHPGTAAILDILGGVLVKLGREAEALVQAQRALAINEQVLGAEHPQTALMAESVARIHTGMAQYEQALVLNLRALAIREKTQGVDHFDIAVSANDLATVYDRMNRHEQALALKLRALAIHERVTGPDHPDVAVILGNVAQSHVTMARRDLALPLQLRALSIRQKVLGPLHPDTAGSMLNLATNYSALAQPDNALPLQLRALAIYEAAFGPEHPRTAIGLRNLARTYGRLGQHEKALPLLQRSLSISEKVQGAEHADTAGALITLALGLSAVGQPEQALPLQRRAVAIHEKALGPDHFMTASSLNRLAEVQVDLGQYPQALQHEQRALAIRDRSLGGSHVDTAVSLANLARIQVALDQPLLALPLLQRAEVIFQQTFGPEHPSTALTVSQLALLHLSLGDRPYAIALLKQSVNAYQSLRERVAGIGSEELRSYTGSVANTYQRLAEALTDEGRLPEAQLVLEMLKEDEQFDFIRRSAAENPGRTRIGFNTTEQAWSGRYRQIAGRLAALGAEQQALAKAAKAKLGLSAEQKQRGQALAADLLVAQAAFASFLAGMREDFARKGPARGVELAESSVQALGELRALLQGLGEDAVLLQIYLTDDKVNLLLTSPGVQLARSSPVGAKALNRQIAEYRRLLRDPKSDPLPAAQALYQLLIAPVAQDLAQAGAKTVMLSLDGVLRYLPFGALHDGQRYLAQRWALPLYTSVTRDRLRDAVAPQWQAAGLGLTRKLGEFDPLPGVQAEMDGIIRSARSASAAGALPGEVHLDEAFTAQRLKDVSQRHFSVLHIASHFRFSPGTEANSFLLLGDGQQLTLGELRTQNYRFDQVDLLTLSACDTGLGGGRDERGREIEGFGVIAQQQGAKAVLATLWPVADQSTAQLMADLYRRRQEQRLSKVEALRQAQLALQAQPRTSHPFYWAPFILMGNWK